MNLRGLGPRVAATCAVACSCALLVEPAAAGQKAPIVLKKQGYFYVGGTYDNPTEPTYMHGQMYVEYQIPVKARKYPLIFIHGGSHTGVGWQTTPDGRPGWADYFVRRGWKVYNVDQPGRGRSNYVPTRHCQRGSPRPQELGPSPKPGSARQVDRRCRGDRQRHSDAAARRRRAGTPPSSESRTRTATAR